MVGCSGIYSYLRVVPHESRACAEGGAACVGALRSQQQMKSVHPLVTSSAKS
jgi:hypothetical protein